jgi:hypothetical protein
VPSKGEGKAPLVRCHSAHGYIETTAFQHHGIAGASAVASGTMSLSERGAAVPGGGSGPVAMINDFMFAPPAASEGFRSVPKPVPLYGTASGSGGRRDALVVMATAAAGGAMDVATPASDRDTTTLSAPDHASDNASGSSAFPPPPIAGAVTAPISRFFDTSATGLSAFGLAPRQVPTPRPI